MKSEIFQLKEFIDKQKREIAHLSANMNKLIKLKDELQETLVSTKEVLKSEGVLMKQQMVTHATELAILKHLLQKDIEDAINSNDAETSKLKTDVVNQRKLLVKNLDSEDLINQELIQLIEQINRERATARSDVEKAAHRVEYQTSKFLIQLNKVRVITEEHFKMRR